MIVCFAIIRDHRHPQESFSFEFLEKVPVVVKCFFSEGQDFVQRFKLGIQKCTGEFTEHIRRANVDPGVFVYCTTKELLSVGSLVADDFIVFSSG